MLVLKKIFAFNDFNQQRLKLDSFNYFVIRRVFFLLIFFFFLINLSFSQVFVKQGTTFVVKDKVLTNFTSSLDSSQTYIFVDSKTSISNSNLLKGVIIIKNNTSNPIVATNKIQEINIVKIKKNIVKKTISNKPILFQKIISYYSYKIKLNAFGSNFLRSSNGIGKTCVVAGSYQTSSFNKKNKFLSFHKTIFLFNSYALKEKITLYLKSYVFNIRFFNYFLRPPPTIY